MSIALAYTAQITIQDCCECGGPIAMSHAQEAEFRRNHKSFCCALGHGQSYTGKSDAEKLKEAESALAVARSRATSLQWEKERAEKKAAQLRKRIAAGVCPLCNRTFSALARHMAAQHPCEAAK